jgi:citrate lyase subunit beta/citryl-CoA lyase
MLRSLLFVPGDRPDQMRKALASGADALILDLEDAVALQNKEAARDHVTAFLRIRPRAIPLFVRIDAIHTKHVELDLMAVAAGEPDGVVLPKAEGARSVLELGGRMSALGMPTSGRILPIATETPIAVFRLGEFETVADSLAGLTWGAEDLPAAVGAASAREFDGKYTAPYEVVRSLALFAARAASTAAIETVYPKFRDVEGLTEYAKRGARDGFSGMMAIHPNQVPLINAAFSPSAATIERAKRIVEEFAAHPGAGVLNIDGAMVDAPHLEQAKRLLRGNN